MKEQFHHDLWKEKNLKLFARKEFREKNNQVTAVCHPLPHLILSLTWIIEIIFMLQMRKLI